jgi:hypothetical protein
MIKHKKVTYTLEKGIIDFIENKSIRLGISKSKLISFYIQSGYDLLVDEYYENECKPLIGVRKKRDNTIPKTFTLPIDVENTLSWFSEKLGLKKSHLVLGCIVDYEIDSKRKEDDKISHIIGDLMKIVDESYHK